MVNIYRFSDTQRGKEQSLTANHENEPCAIIIENGGYECRAGPETSDEPALVFKNLAFRQKGRNNEPDTVFVGRDIENFETVRTQLKSPFDRNIVTQFDTQEMIYDYVFSKLGVQSIEHVGNPVVMSEPISNSNYCRNFMSELMFEGYCVPSLTYYTDALSSWYRDQHGTSTCENGITISIGYQTIHVVPIVEGRVDQQNIRRVSVGGYHTDYFTQRLLQLKYPIHSSAISLTRAEQIVQNHTWVAEDFKEACNEWTDLLYYDKKVNYHGCRMFNKCAIIFRFPVVLRSK